MSDQCYGLTQRGRGRWQLALGLGLLSLLAASCQKTSAVPTRSLQIHQDWVLQPGSQVGDYRVTGGLGDVSIDLQGDTVRAPFDGLVQPHRPSCVIYSSPEVPAYVFRICGLSQSQVGEIRASDTLGRGQTVQFAALRRQPDGTWAIVEPAVDVLEQMVESP